MRTRGRTTALGSVTLSSTPQAPRTLRITLSTKDKIRATTPEDGRHSVRFIVRDPITKKISHRSTKTFGITVKR